MCGEDLQKGSTCPLGGGLLFSSFAGVFFSAAFCNGEREREREKEGSEGIYVLYSFSPPPTSLPVLNLGFPDDAVPSVWIREGQCTDYSKICGWFFLGRCCGICDSYLLTGKKRHTPTTN